MGISATSLTGNGLRDWLVQRATAIFLACYTLFILGYIVSHSPLDYSVWSALFDHLSMKLASSIMLVSVLLHAWVGMWTVLTDYVKPVCIRLALHFSIVASLIACMIWGLTIFWSF